MKLTNNLPSINEEEWLLSPANTTNKLTTPSSFTINVHWSFLANPPIVTQITDANAEYFFIYFYNEKSPAEWDLSKVVEEVI